MSAPQAMRWRRTTVVQAATMTTVMGRTTEMMTRTAREMATQIDELTTAVVEVGVDAAGVEAVSHLLT
jgi:hypothetical protein